MPGIWAGRILSGLEELLESDVDTIYVALPNHLHYGFAKKALLAGKHVILEKPGTSNAAQMRELEKLAAQEKKMLLEAMNIHYLPVFQSLKEHLKDLGTIKIVSLNYSQYSSRYDAFRRGEVLAAFDPKRAGGALMDLNVYNIHAAVGLFGKPESVRYEANVEREIDTSRNSHHGLRQLQGVVHRRQGLQGAGPLHHPGNGGLHRDRQSR